MQPASKSRTWANEEPSRIKSGHQVSIVHGDGDGNDNSAGFGSDQGDNQGASEETEKAQTNTANVSTKPAAVAPSLSSPDPVRNGSDAENAPKIIDSKTPPTTDDDWLRSRTSRLLGLVDDDESNSIPVVFEHTEDQQGRAPDTAKRRSSSGSMDAGTQSIFDPHLNKTGAAPPSDLKNDPMNATSRLFVRNLPYTATENDIRQHLEYLELGNVEEVGTFISQATL